MATKCNLEGAMNKCRSCRTQFMYIYIYIYIYVEREGERERERDRERDGSTKAVCATKSQPLRDYIYIYIYSHVDHLYGTETYITPLNNITSR
jgi:hypothetical protein